MKISKEFLISLMIISIIVIAFVAYSARGVVHDKQHELSFISSELDYFRRKIAQLERENSMLRDQAAALSNIIMNYDQDIDEISSCLTNATAAYLDNDMYNSKLLLECILEKHPDAEVYDESAELYEIIVISHMNLILNTAVMMATSGDHICAQHLLDATRSKYSGYSFNDEIESQIERTEMMIDELQ